MQKVVTLDNYDLFDLWLGKWLRFFALSLSLSFNGVNDAADADAAGPIFSSIELINFEKQQWQWPN